MTIDSHVLQNMYSLRKNKRLTQTPSILLNNIKFPIPNKIVVKFNCAKKIRDKNYFFLISSYYRETVIF